MTRGKTDLFLDRLQTALAAELPGAWERRPAPEHTLLLRYDWGYGSVGPSMTYKHLPACRVFLTYGVYHASLRPLMQKVSAARGEPFVDFCHAYHDTQNRPLAAGERWSSVDDYLAVDPGPIVKSLLGSGAPELLALFERMADLREVRAALEGGDNTFFALGSEKVVVAIDFVLSDRDHLRRYRASRKPVPGQRLVDDAIRALGMDP
jgi:hypothetical protein